MDDPEDTDAIDPAESLVDAYGLEIEKRLWAKQLISIITCRSRETDPSERVQFAMDCMQIAACERLTRVLRSDLPEDQR